MEAALWCCLLLDCQHTFFFKKIFFYLIHKLRRSNFNKGPSDVLEALLQIPTLYSLLLIQYTEMNFELSQTFYFRCL